MVIYGVMLLGSSLLVGLVLGDLLGFALGTPVNVGGIGFAMLFLVLISNKSIEKGWMTKLSEDGVKFWNAMYIPIVVAMSASQDMVAAIKGGGVAIIAGLGAVILCFFLIKPLSLIGANKVKENCD
ncbi:malonate transporter subunit MadL [Yersinia pseudotuberculosis]|uniref:malonate transporter subunit MadL n=1 Tax=Yersinia pseudotuberculosis TaxID=633 RepID=UPI0005E71620|nr:malonate transporter subunit MadL [Yersinia pseudotuberculosis]CNC80677.1 malonate transporter%2C MadL subunit [Yersinia pseudotuberculosis]